VTLTTIEQRERLEQTGRTTTGGGITRQDLES
jgi:hypothetical protein